MSPVTIPALTTIVDRQFKTGPCVHYFVINKQTNKVQVKAHDIRAFAASKAFYSGVSVDEIMQSCHWKVHNTFTNFYLKDLTWSDDNNVYLGPVVAVQQVLDPSPQTSYPRKEGGGGTSTTTKSSGVQSQDLGIGLPLRMLWVRSFLLSLYIVYYVLRTNQGCH